jgi:hypothetical protein
VETQSYRLETKSLPLLRLRDGGIRQRVLICSNLIGRRRSCRSTAGPRFRPGVLFFPHFLTSSATILTEVYGYCARAQGDLGGFAGLAFASVMAPVVVALPPAPFWSIRARTRSRSPHLAHRARLDVRLLLRRVRQFVRAREDEDLRPRPLVVDAHHRLDDRRRAVDSAAFHPLAFYGAGIIPERQA